MVKNTKSMNLLNILKKDIENCNFPIGSKFPSNRELAKRFNVSYLTIHNVLINLEDEGYIKRFQGRGSFVTSIKQNKIVNSDLQTVGYFLDVKTEMFALFFSKIIQMTKDKNISNLPCQMLPAKIGIAQKDYEVWLKECFDANYHSVIIYGDRHFPFKLLKQYENHVTQMNFILFNDSAINFPNANQVLVDLKQAGYMAASHLIKRRCKKIALLSIRQLDPMYRRRMGLKFDDHEHLILDGIEKAFSENSLDFYENFKWLDDHRVTSEEIVDLIEQGFYGFFAMSDNRTTRLYEIAKLYNLQIGKDILVVGIGNTPLSRILEPKLTTISIAEEEIAEQCANFILGQEKKQISWVKPELIIRKST